MLTAQEQFDLSSDDPQAGGVLEQLLPTAIRAILLDGAWLLRQVEALHEDLGESLLLCQLLECSYGLGSQDLEQWAPRDLTDKHDASTRRH